MKTRADFKATRESLGMSQQLLADLMEVEIRSVKRWEKPNENGWYEPPAAAWIILDRFSANQVEAIESILETVADAEEEHGKLAVVNLTYWRSAEHFEAAHPGEGSFWQMANANARLAAYLLESMGYTVEFNFEGLAALLQ